MSLTVNTSAGFPDNLGGTLVNVPSGTADEIFIYNDGGNLWKRVLDSGFKVYKSSWLKTSTAPADLTARFNTMIADARVEIVEIDADITLNGTITVPTGKSLRFKNGKILGTGTLNGGIIDASYQDIIFGSSLTVNFSKSASDMISVKWYGATGDGTTNDAPAIQRAIDSIIRNDTMSRDLYYPHGQYKIDQPLIAYKWTGTDYAFFSLNMIGSDSANFNNEQTEARILPSFVDSFAIGYQVGRSSVIRGLVIKGQFNPPGMGDPATYFERPFATWASDYGVVDSQTHPYAGIVIDPFRNTNTIPLDGPYGGTDAFGNLLSTYYRGTGALTNSGCSGVRIEFCKVSNFTVDIIISPNGETSNAENIHVSDCTLEVAKVAYSATQDQCKDNFVKRMISWDRIHTCIDTVTYGRQVGMCPYVDGWNIAGAVTRVWNLFSLRSVAAIENIFAEGLYRIGDCDAGLGLSVKNCTFDMFLSDPIIQPSSQISGSNIDFYNCSFRYHDNTFSRTWRIKGYGYKFSKCLIERPPILNYAYGRLNLLAATFEDCRTGYGLLSDTNVTQGYLRPDSPTHVAHGKLEFKDGGGFGYNGNPNNYPFSDFHYKFDLGEYQKAVPPATYAFTINATTRTGSVTITGDNREFYIAVGDVFVTNDDNNHIIGTVTSIDRVTGFTTFDKVPVTWPTGTYGINFTSIYVPLVRGSFIGDLTAGSKVITNVDHNDLFPPAYVGMRLKIGTNWVGAGLDPIIDAIDTSAKTITMSVNADYSETAAYNPLASCDVNREQFTITSQFAPADYWALPHPGLNNAILFPKGGRVLYHKNNPAGAVEQIIDKAGWIDPATVGKLHKFTVVPPPAGTNVTNAGNNRVITSDGTAPGLVAETNFTFDGNTVGATGGISGAALVNILKGVAGDIAKFGSTTSGTQLTVDDTVSGVIYAVNDVSGLPIIEATSAWDVNIYDYPNIIFKKQGLKITIARLNLSLIGTFADDAAASGGGLVAGDVYKTSTGELRIKL